MEKSVRRVEKLVHATNSALAQMKLGLMFDDAGGERGNVGGGRGPRFPEDSGERGDDLVQRQEEFRSEADEVLSKMEKMLGSKETGRKTSNALSRIKEINRKMNVIRQEHVRPRGVEQTRDKLLSVTPKQKPLPENPCDRALLPTSKSPSPPKREAQCILKKIDILPSAHCPAKSKEELKDKILETREIVNRGFHTARQLALKVDSIAKNEKKEKMTGSEKIVREGKARSSGGGSENFGTAERIRCGRDRRREEKVVREGSEGNATVIDVRQRERRGDERPHLKLQRLPSVHIRGGLQLQKVHSLEIPATEDGGCSKANTGIHFLSHEQIERTRMEKMLDEMRRDNCYCHEERADMSKSASESYVECSNCGKVMRVQVPKGAVDQRRVDDILRRCNFNVFDPRIDEFVEKYGTIDAGDYGEAEPKVDVTEDIEIEERGSLKRKEKNEAKRDTDKARKDFSLEDLSNRLSNKYREEANALEGTHLRLDSLLRSLLRKMDESREIFEECHLFKNERVLTTKKPISSLTESSQRSIEKQKLNKKDVKNRSRSRTGGAKRLCLFSQANEKAAGEVTLFRESVHVERKFSRGGIKRKSGGSRRKRREAMKEKCQTPTSISSCQSVSPNRKSVNRSMVKSMEGKEERCKDEVSKMAEINGMKPDVLMATARSRAKEDNGVENNTSARSCYSYRLEECELRTEVVEEERDSSVTKEERSAESGKMEVVQPVVTFGNEGKSPSETSEKSDNNYASDFESTTNESEEEEEQEVVATATKLSTISEVDSELEKKVSDEQKTQRGKVPADEPQEDIVPNHHRCNPANPDVAESKKSSPLSSEVSSQSRRAEEAPPRASDVSRKSSTSTELVTSLKDILSALKDQFARTETLAEKLTENATKQEGGERRVGSRSLSWMMEGLRSARSDRVVSEGSESSVGEVVERWRSEKESESEGSILKLFSSRRSSRQKAKNVKSEEVSYSEGEIPSDVLMDSECCSNYSLGEIR